MKDYYRVSLYLGAGNRVYGNYSTRDKALQAVADVFADDATYRGFDLHIVKFTPTLDTDGGVYTDSNGDLLVADNPLD